MVRNFTTKLLIPFQLFGFLLAIVPLRNKRLEWILLFLASLNACIVATLAWSCYYYAEFMFDFSNKIGLIVDVTQIVAPILAHLIAILEALYNRKTIRRLWIEIFEIIEMGGEHLQTILRKVYIKFVVKAFVLHILATALEVRILWGIMSSWFRSRATAEWSFIGCRTLYIFYFLHVDIIGGILDSVAIDLQAVSRASISQLKSKRLEMDTKELLNRVEFNRGVFNKVYSIVQRLNVCFGWALISNLINNFLAITIAFYWNYRGVYIERLTTGLSVFLDHYWSTKVLFLLLCRIRSLFASVNPGSSLHHLLVRRESEAASKDQVLSPSN